MEFRQLEAFAATVETKSFSAAADLLFLTQPTISAHVHSLEKELHTRLIRRTTKKFELTPDGQRLYEYAVSILKLQKKAVFELSSFNKQELHIGASSVPGQCLLPELMAAYHRIAPEIRFRTCHSDSLDVVKQVSEGSLDIGFVGTVSESDCTFVPLASDELVIAAPNTPRYQQLLQSDVSLEELLKEPILMRTGNSGTMRETEHFLTSLGISVEQLNVAAFMNDSEALRNCVIRGLGITILSRRMVESLCAQKELLIFPLGNHRLIRKLYLVYVKDRYMPKAAEDFLAFLEEYQGSHLAAPAEAQR